MNPDPGRTLAIARSNTVLMARNKVTLIYALALPLVPLAMLFIIDTSEPAAVLSQVASGLLLAWLFPVYYNLLSMLTTRRDELVLKRIRTGETSDTELLVGMALPGIVISLIAALVITATATAVSGDLPAAVWLVPLVSVIGSVLFATLAVWTASWTRTAEAAQLTSTPVMLIGVAGLVAAALPTRAQELLSLTPGAALYDLAAYAWTGSFQLDSLVHPLIVVVLWCVVAAQVARMSMRWEPRG